MCKVFKVYDSMLGEQGYAGQWLGKDVEEAQERYIDHCEREGWMVGTLRVVDTGKEFA